MKLPQDVVRVIEELLGDNKVVEIVHQKDGQIVVRESAKTVKLRAYPITDK